MKVRSLQYTHIGGAMTTVVHHFIDARERQEVRQDETEISDKPGSACSELTRGRMRDEET